MLKYVSVDLFAYYFTKYFHSWRIIRNFNKSIF